MLRRIRAERIRDLDPTDSGSAVEAKSCPSYLRRLGEWCLTYKEGYDGMKLFHGKDLQSFWVIFLNYI